MVARFIYEVRHLGLADGSKKIQSWIGEATNVDVMASEDGEPALYVVFDGQVPVFSLQASLFESGRVLEFLTRDDTTTDIGEARKRKATGEKAPLAEPKPL